jgi:leucine dehydrogenase
MELSYILLSSFQDESSDLKGYISFYKGSDEFPFFGATRIWSYSNEKEAIEDAKKLSKVMTYKSIMAGYKYGGAKAVIIAPKERNNKWLHAYAKIVNYFKGGFITGADAGMSEEELKILSEVSSYIIGTKSDPIPCTIHGLYTAIQVVVEKVFLKNQSEHISIAIQGMGKTGSGLLDLLKDHASTIYISDINMERMNSIAKQYKNIVVVEPDKIHTVPVDIFSPCALSGSLNAQTVPELQCKAVIGSANSQLSSDDIGEALYKRGIFYAPDYVVNAGGFMAVVEEYEQGSMSADNMTNISERISKNLSSIIEKSNKTSVSSFSVADTYVRDKMVEYKWIQT